MRYTLFLLALLLIGFSARAEYVWPERVVTIEDMRLMVPIKISVPSIRPKGEIKGPTVLRVHVDPEGLVRRAVLLASCGSSAHDEAALNSMRSVRFKPYLVDGTATDVTLAVPLHLPMPKSQINP